MSDALNTRAEKPSPPVAASATSPSVGKGTERSAAPKAGDEEIKKLVEALAQGQATGQLNRTLSNNILRLVEQSADPGQISLPSFRTGVAYALQDFEKLQGNVGGISPQLRTEMTALAATAPGLKNERAQNLLRDTAGIDSPDLVRQIREFAARLVEKRSQTSPGTTSGIEALENRIRLAPRVTEPQAASQTQTPPTRPAEDTAQQSAPPPRQAQAAAAQDEAKEREPAYVEGFRAGAERGFRGAGGSQGQAAGGPQGSILDTMLRAMRPDSRQGVAPWDPAATPMVDRIAAVERFVQGEKNDKTLQNAEVSGRAALQALQGFTNTEGAAVMGKIQAAASAAPGGMQEVLTGMRAGGQFADLRKQFSNALSDDAGFAAAYDKAASSLASYGKNRTDAQAVIVQQPNANTLAQRFEKLDSEIGAAASSTPSKNEGRNMVEDLAKQAADLLRNAVNVVKSVFTRSADASTSASPSPSP